MVTQNRPEIIEPNFERARRVLAKPMVMLARNDFIERQVRVWSVLAIYFDHITLGV